MEPVGPASPGMSLRELVHDDDLSVLHHVVHVLPEEGVGLQGWLMCGSTSICVGS